MGRYILFGMCSKYVFLEPWIIYSSDNRMQTAMATGLMWREYVLLDSCLLVNSEAEALPEEAGLGLLKQRI